MRTLVAYVPVLHEGYLRFFQKYEGQKELYIFGLTFIQADRALARDIRQIDPALVKKAVEALKIFDRVEVLDEVAAAALNVSGMEIVLPDEDVSRELAEKYFTKTAVTFDPIFLRWDKHNSVAEMPVVPDEQLTHDEFHKKIISLANAEAERSSDNWRHVGAAVVKDGEVILIGHNHHVPSPHTPYVAGDPRNNFRRGVNIEISTGFHAEASLIAEAARRGIALEGAAMYVTTFPCPPCAKLIAHSGIATLYAGGGHSVLDGQEILRNRGVKIIFVV